MEIQETEEYKPARIVCPKCNSVSIAFVTEYHKAIGWRVILFIVNALFVAIIISMLEHAFSEYENIWKGFFKDFYPAFLIYAFIFFICKISISTIESHTHVQAICRDCGYLWLLN